MASLDPTFHQETANIHREHEELVAQLDQLDAALDQIFCYAEIFTDLATANQATSRGKWRQRYAAGHFSYRNVAYAMYEAVTQRYPALAKYFRVTDVREPVDLLKR